MSSTGGQVLVDQLELHGVEHAFCVPGESYLPVLDALHDANIRLISCRHEAAAANMAEAYGKLTGRPGVCLVTRGPGVRVLLKGRIRIDSGGESHEYGPGEWWYESGPEPVFAAASPDEETAFVRVMLVPRELEGKRTIRYVDPADDEKPKLQRARIYLEEPLA